MDLSNRFTAGTPGATITQGSGGNSGGVSGDYFNFVQSGTAAPAFTSTLPWGAGKMGALLAGGGYLRWNNTATQDRVVARVPLYFTANPASDFPFIQFRSSGGVACGDIAVLTGGNAGKVAIRPAFAYHAPSLTSTALSTNTLYWVEVAITKGTTTANGRMEYVIYDSTGTGTPLFTYDSGATVNTSVNRAEEVRFTGGASGTSVYYTDLRAKSLASGWIGGFGASAPTATCGADVTVSSGGTASLTGSASDDSAIVSRLWTCTSRPTGASLPTINNAATDSATAMLTTAGVYEFTYTVTDDDGLTASDTLLAYVPALSVRPNSVVSNTGFTNVGGAASVTAALADELASTYAEAAAVGQSVLVVQLNPIQATPTTFSLALDHSVSATTTATTYTVQLLEGATVRKTWSPTAPTTTSSRVTLTLTGGEIATVTNWNALRLRITWED